jgi:hypothetical protein
MFDLESFEFTQMIRLGAGLRNLADGAKTMEAVATRIVHYFYDAFTFRATGQKACVLVRLFKTHAFGDLDEGLRQSAMKMLGEVSASPSMKCLTLLATAGERLEWNSRAASVGHKAIPLPSEKAVENIPMIARLFSQLGVNPGVLLQPDPAFMLKTDQSNFNVFHVPEAQGSPYVPAQKEFVIPCGVKSVLGYGGLLPNGDIFAVILFVKVHVPQETAELFKTLALSTKLILIPFSKDKVFAA